MVPNLPLCLLLAGLLAQATASSLLNLLPQPTHSSIGNTTTCLDPGFSISFSAHAPADLRAAATRTTRAIRASKMRYLSPTYGAEFFPSGAGCTHWVKSLTVAVNDAATIAAHATRKAEARVEGYNLTLPADGEAHIAAETALGAFRGLTSFQNLWYRHNGDVYAPFAPYAIADSPQFPWRSLLLDTSRNYFPPATLRAMLDAMARVKLSVFHWHLTDSQSWPLRLNAMPELADKGAYEPSRVYSEADVRQIIAYANARGIDVVIEIDTPGHTASLWYSHPELIACHAASPWGDYANEPPAGQLRFADPNVTAWTAQLFANVIPLTSSAYFGTGGDELNVNCMMSDAATNATLAAKNITLQQALAQFTQGTHKTLIEHKRSPMVWEEMVLDHGELGLSNDTVVDVWISSANTRTVADKGYRLVHASSDYFYLDCGRGEWINQDGGANSWCDPYKSWQLMYSFDPYNNITDAQRSLVLGGQASLWAEQADATNYETVLWPRGAALAELFWTGSANTGNASFPRSALDALPRMHDARFRLVDAGVDATPLAPEWCALRPGACDLTS